MTVIDDVRVDPATARVYEHGWQSWSPTRVHGVREASARPEHAWQHTMRFRPGTPLAADGFQAEGLLLVDPGTGEPVRAYAATDPTIDVPTLRARLTGDRLVVATDAPDQVAASMAQDLGRGLAAIGDSIGRQLDVVLRAPPTVWCSWYHYFLDVTESDIVENLDAFARHDLSVDVVQVDDGWQRQIGDWKANDAFPSGMRALADRIRAAGFRPGLWVAPFLAHERSQLLRDHPEWLLRDEAGALVSAGWNWGGRVHALDVTHPDALARVAEVLRTVVGWGFDYLKLDFVYAGALPGVRHADVERHVAYRQAIQALRGVVGDEVVLLACGAPVVPSLGVFDALRVGPDVAEVWENAEATRYLHRLAAPQARYAVATSVHRLWLRPLIGTDPDVAYFRTRYCLLSEEQKGLIADLTRVCRFRATSDVPATLDRHERDALAAYLTEDVEVTRLGRYRYDIGGREVDFGLVAAEPPVMLPTPG